MRILVLLLVFLASAPALPSWQDDAALRDSLSQVHPKMRASWLRERGYDDSYYTTFRKLDSTGLRCIGRWPWGPSWELCGRDSLLFLGSGSGVRILSISDSTHPRMLGQINARGLVSQLVVRDTLLFVACGSWGAQVYSVADPADPQELGSMDAVIGDLALVDTLCYCLGGDTFRIYRVANLAQPEQLGAVTDSGDVVVVANGHAFCGGRWGMNVYDVSNPRSPVRVNARGGTYYAMQVRRNLLFCTGTQPDHMSILDVSDPRSIGEVSLVPGYGGRGLYVDESYAYLSCTYEHSALFVIDVSDTAHPVLRDSLDPEGTTEWDPHVPHESGFGYLADDYGGLVVMDLHDVNAITEVWSGYKAGLSLDISVDAGRAYVANDLSGLQIVDVDDPSKPRTLGLYDVVGSKATFSATARDSFAFMGMTAQPSRRHLLVLSVIDPSQPTLVAQESCHNWPQDMVLSDSLLYVAQAYFFHVFNVARPREPVLVGSCNLPGTPLKLVLGDTVAYAATYGVQCVNVADPNTPFVAGAYGSRVSGMDIVDTILYGAGPYTGLIALSMANPAMPRLLDSLHLTDTLWWNDVVVVDSLAYVGGERVWVVDVSDPRDLRLVPGASWTPPYLVRRLEYSSPYLYAACYEAGVCVLESTQVAISEELGGARPKTQSVALRPNPTKGSVVVQAGLECESAIVHDVLGRTVKRFKPGGATFEVDLTGLQPGLYFIELRYSFGREVEKLVKR
ncbi:MAG: T9SS type A sorting domain-containing protein [candidate division WOR-3 bacterium]|nr:MAG: T9SS type A sorting domain-containing protein [candidate division WOR-3 bacterium]